MDGSSIKLRAPVAAEWPRRVTCPRVPVAPPNERSWPAFDADGLASDACGPLTVCVDPSPGDALVGGPGDVQLEIRFVLSLMGRRGIAVPANMGTKAALGCEGLVLEGVA